MDRLLKAAIGPLVTLASVGAAYLVDRYVFAVPNPGAISFLAVAFSAYIGGLGPGLASAAISIAYAAVAFSEPGHLMQFAPDNMSRLIVLAAATPAVAILVGALHRQARRALARERSARATAEARNREFETLRGALDRIDVGIVLLDRELRAQFINDAFRRMWQLPDSLADRKPAFVGLMYHGRNLRAYAVPPEELDAYVRERTAAVQAGDERPLDLRLANGDVLRFRCKVLPDGGRMLTYGNVSDIVHGADALEKLATHDSMTGLYNRGQFLELAEQEWERSRRYQRPLSLLVLDIDHFKAVNDAHGHDAGDRVIIAVAAACRGGKRNSDIVGRLGGEEFGILLPETQLKDALAFAERLRRAIAEHAVPGQSIPVTISVGVAAAGEGASCVPDLIKQADVALYEAKRGGRNRVCAHTPAGTAAA